MKTQDEVNNLINCLTNDEDKRQELWAHYLSGNATSSLAAYLDKINKEYSVDFELQSRIWHILKNPPSERFYNLLSRFSKVEQSIVALLALGFKVADISGYKGISEIRIRQVIFIIKENDCWEELYGIKETTNTGRKIRAE